MTAGPAETIRKTPGWCPDREFALRYGEPGCPGMRDERGSPVPEGGGRGSTGGTWRNAVPALSDMCLLALIAALQIIVLYPIGRLNGNDGYSLIVPAGSLVFWLLIVILAYTRRPLDFGTRKLLIGCVLSSALILEIIVHLI